MKREKYTFKQIVESLPKKKNSRSSLWVKIIIRKISFFVTYIFINLGLSANTTSVISAFVVLAGSILLGIDYFICRLIGAILINFWLVLDCVDGNIARCKKQSSYMGEFYDALGGYSATAFSIFGVGVAAYFTCNWFSQKFNYLFIIIGGLGSVANVFARLIYQRYTNAVFTTNLIVGEDNDMPENYSEDKHSFAYWREFFDKNFGISGLFMVLLLIAPFINCFDCICILYSGYYGLAFCVTFYMYCKKAKSYDIQINNKFGSNIK